MVLLVITLIINIYILKSLAVIGERQNALGNIIVSMGEEMILIRKLAKEVIIKLDHSFNIVHTELETIDKDICEKHFTVVTNQEDIYKSAERIESYMDISKNTLIEMCEKLKKPEKPEIDCVPVTEAYNLLNDAISYNVLNGPISYSPALPEDYVSVIQKALTHLGIFLFNNAPKEETDE